MLLAHGLFKAPLFLVVGIDRPRRPGRATSRRLSGLGTALPGAARAAGSPAASMAGLPPLLGFSAKEAAFEAFVREGGGAGWAVEVGLLARLGADRRVHAPGSSGAPSARKPGRGRRAVRHRPALVAEPCRSWVCARSPGSPSASWPRWWTSLGVQLRRSGVRRTADGYHLALGTGPGLPLLFSRGRRRGGLRAAPGARRRGSACRRSPLDAQRGYERTVAGRIGAGGAVTGRLQAGSLPATSGTSSIACVMLPGRRRCWPGAWPATVDCTARRSQVPLGAAVVIAALVADHAGPARFTAVLRGRRDRVRRRRVVRRGRGARSRAGRMFLVETLSLVAFVLVLRRLPARVHRARPTARVRRCRKAVLGAARRRDRGGRASPMVLSAARTEPASASADYRAAGPGASRRPTWSARSSWTSGHWTRSARSACCSCAAAGVASLVLATRHDRRGRRSDGRSGQSSPRARGGRARMTDTSDIGSESTPDPVPFEEWDRSARGVAAARATAAATGSGRCCSR